MVNLHNSDIACSFYDYMILDFNLDFYTEVQDLSYLENSLSASLFRPVHCAEYGHDLPC